MSTQKNEQPTQHEIADANRHTGESCGEVSGGFICTRTPGHTGLHVASNGTEGVKSWPITPPTDTMGSGREGETGCGPKSGHCAECGTTEGALVLLEDTTLCEECNMADHVVKLRLIDELTARVEALRRDGERLQWILDLIAEHGTDGLQSFPWSILNDPANDPDEDDPARLTPILDRAAIDSAQRQEGR